MCSGGFDSGDEFAGREGEWGKGAAEICVAGAHAREMTGGSTGSHRHKPTPLNPERHYTPSVRTREVNALMVRPALTAKPTA